MDNQTLFLLKIIFGSLSILFGVLAAWFELQDRWQTGEEREKTKENYGRKWRIITSSGFLELPEKVIKWFIRIKNEVVSLGQSWLIKPKKIQFKIRKIVKITIPVLGFAALWLQFGLFVAFIITLPLIFHMLFTLLNPNYQYPLFKNWLFGFIYGLMQVLYIFVGITFLIMILKLPIIYSTLLIAVFIVIYPELFTLPVAILSILILRREKFLKFYLPESTLFALAMTFSFFLTACSLTIGHVVRPEAWVPQTLQMLFSNVFFDGMTILATVLILRIAMEPSRKLNIPLAIILDIVIAAILACCSLWFGLVGTERALSFKQIYFILIGKSIDGAQFEFGPCFWAMHTAFLPTLFYLCIILLCWIGKLIVLPIAHLLMKGEVVEKPHRLTAGVLLFLAVIFGGLWKGAGLIQEHREKKEITQPIQDEKKLFSMPLILEKPEAIIKEASGSQKP